MLGLKSVKLEFYTTSLYIYIYRERERERERDFNWFIKLLAIYKKNL